MGQAVSGYNPQAPALQRAPQVGVLAVEHMEPFDKEPDMDMDDAKGQVKKKRRMKKLPPQVPQKEPHRIIGGEVRKPGNPMLEMMGGKSDGMSMPAKPSSTPRYK